MSYSTLTVDRMLAAFFLSFFDIGATDSEWDGKVCRHLAVVTLYQERFFWKKFAGLRNTPYLCSEKNKESQTSDN